jgi:hypothetical protein
VCSARNALAAATTCIVLGGARLAHAGPTDPDPVTLAWTAPKECPTGADVRARTAARLPPDTSVRATGHVERIGSGQYRLALEIEAKGERTIEAATCDALASSAAVVLAMSVSPATAEMDATAPLPAPARSSSPAAPASPERDVVAPRAARSSTVSARLHGIADVGTLPAIGGGGGLAVGFDPIARLHLELHGNLWAAQDGTLAADPSRGAAFQLVTAGARGCWGLTRPIVLAPCVGAEVSVLTGTGFGANRTSDATAVAWAPEAGLTLLVPLGSRFALRAGLGGTAPTSRQAFVIAAGGEVHRSSALVVRGFLGPEVAF